MAEEEEVGNITVGEFETIPQLLASSEAVQIAFAVLIIGLIIIGIVYHKFSHWILSQKFNYSRPHVSRFARKAILPFFAIVLVSSTNAYITSTGLFEGENVFAEDELNPAETFAKILDSINILVIGWTVSHLIPITLLKREKSNLEQTDSENWNEMNGFPDHDGDLFQKCCKWIPPKTTP
ncbi:MAG: mechanosensitive ion channel protein MscS, partial [Thaumarchaeota archaeon]|nr:mechanosensitive ion channel protein MscS [Nitrososphaerota archaeon]